MRGKMNGYHQEFVELWNNDKILVRDIAKRFDVTIAYVSQYAKKHRRECPKRYGRERVDVGRKSDRISRVNHDEFVRLWNADVPTRKMAKYFGVCNQYISKYAKKHENDCPKRNKGAKYKFLAQTVIQMWNDGLSVGEIAVKLGVTSGCVSLHLKKACVGYEAKRAKVDFDEFKKMWNNGVDATDIARRFGVTKHYVYNYASAHKGMGLDRKAGKNKSLITGQ